MDDEKEEEEEEEGVSFIVVVVCSADNEDEDKGFTDDDVSFAEVFSLVLSGLILMDEITKLSI